MNELLKIIRAHIDISGMKETWCQFSKTYIPLEADGSLLFQKGDHCKVIYQFEVIQGDELISYENGTYQTWYEKDSFQELEFANRVKNTLILRGIFQK